MHDLEALIREGVRHVIGVEHGGEPGWEDAEVAAWGFIGAEFTGGDPVFDGVG
jgi:hypothetical protein